MANEIDEKLRALFYDAHDAMGLEKWIEKARLALTAPVATEQAQAVAMAREALIDLIEERLYGVYHCGRVWEAWHVGTMSQDDFTEARGSELAPDLADAIIAKFAASPEAAPAATGLCEHEWVSARNEVIKSGEICAKLCGAIRSEQDGTSDERLKAIEYLQELADEAECNGNHRALFIDPRRKFIEAVINGIRPVPIDAGQVDPPTDAGGVIWRPISDRESRRGMPTGSVMNKNPTRACVGWAPAQAKESE